MVPPLHWPWEYSEQPVLAEQSESSYRSFVYSMMVMVLVITI